MVTSYNNYEDIVIDDLPSELVGCNIKNCTIRNCGNTVFAKCNITTSVFEAATEFSLCNIYYDSETVLPQGCSLYNTNLINLDEQPEPEEELTDKEALDIITGKGE